MNLMEFHRFPRPDDARCLQQPSISVGETGKDTCLGTEAEPGSWAGVVHHGAWDSHGREYHGNTWGKYVAIYGHLPFIHILSNVIVLSIDHIFNGEIHLMILDLMVQSNSAFADFEWWSRIQKEDPKILVQTFSQGGSNANPNQHQV